MKAESKVRKFSEKEMQKLEKAIPHVSQLASRNAFQEALDLGSSVLVAEGEVLVRIYPDGRRVVVKDNEDCNIKNLKDVEIFITKDEFLLRQYFDLRSEIYTKENSWHNYDCSHDIEFDRRSEIIVVVKNDKVIGGCRLMFSGDGILSEEIPDSEYLYGPIIQRYDTRKEINYGEISGFVILSEFRVEEISNRILRISIERFKKLKYNYVCVVAPALVCRSYRRSFLRLGYSLEIMINHPWKGLKKFNYMKNFFTYVKIS